VENVSLDDLHQEITRLWEKAGAAATASPEATPPPASSTANASEVAWETVAMLQSRYRRQERRWAEVLEAREEALRALKERQARLEAELAYLRQRVRADDERVAAEFIEAGSRLEAAQKALEAERAARQSAAAEAARWEKKEQQRLLELQELRALAALRQEEALRAEGVARRLSESLKEAESALEKTLAELLRERRARQETEAEHAQAVKKISEAHKHIE